MADADYYAPGTYNDPNAPWNQHDYDDEVADKQQEIFIERLTDEPDAWIAEGITEQASEKAQAIYLSVIKNLKNGHRIMEDNLTLGAMIRELVEMYAIPSEQEAYEELMEDKANALADRGDYYEER